MFSSKALSCWRSVDVFVACFFPDREHVCDGLQRKENGSDPESVLGGCLALPFTALFLACLLAGDRLYLLAHWVVSSSCNFQFAKCVLQLLCFRVSVASLSFVFSSKTFVLLP